MGLSSKDALAKLRDSGYNEILEVKEHKVVRFLKKFISITPIVIIVSILISIFMGKIVEAIVMTSLLFLNAIISTIQESKADRAVALLRQKINIQVKLLRDGHWGILPSRELVQGDRIKVMLGDIVPADTLVLEGAVSVDQSALTGESIPVERSNGEKLFASSLVNRGQATGDVIATGTGTYFGKTAQLLQTKKQPMVIESITMSLTKLLLAIDIAFIVLVTIIFLISGTSLSDVVPLVLTLLIASIPVALPAMSTVALSLGALELAHQGVIIRSFNAVEAAAMMDVACLDKTGTVTENRIAITDVIPWDNSYTEKHVLVLAVAASERVTRDPIDIAIQARAAKEDIVLGRDYLVSEFKPFDPRSKKAEATAVIGGIKVVAIKGAPQVIAAYTGQTDQLRFNSLIQELAFAGKRALAIAVNVDGNVRLAGLLAFRDPPRPDSAALIEQLKAHGINVKMITGDNIEVARSIAAQIGIEGKVVRVRDIPGFPNPESRQTVVNSGVIAEVVPEDKYWIIELLQEHGTHIVGMTGDGVNDAPALRAAQVGIAVSGSTDVARASAGIILSKDGIKNIVDLVTLGRSIYRRIVTWILNKIIKTFEIVFFVSLATILFQRPAISPVQMLLVLFLFDFVTVSIAVDNIPPSARPEKWSLKRIVVLPSIMGTLNVVELFVALSIAELVFGLPIGEVQTLVFFAILVSGLLNLLSIREKRRFWSSRPRGILFVFIVGDLVAGTVIVTAGFLMAPISITMVAFILAYLATTIFVFNDFLKARIRQRSSTRKQPARMSPAYD